MLDVGGNIGQFSSALRSVGYGGRIVSFEPLSDAHQALSRRAAKDPGWTVYPRTAIGSHCGHVHINIAGNSVSSSVLPMLESHKAAAPGSAYVGAEVVPLQSLDSLLSELAPECHQTFLKIDTQGMEWAVLDGASSLLKHLRGVQCELSLVPLYEGQHLWLDVVGRLELEGFTLWAVQEGFTNPRDGRSLQVDGLFFRL